jgi:methionyl-tRNA synthetase
LIEVAYMLTPFMPGTSERILGAFGVSAGEVTEWEASGTSWGRAQGRTVTQPEPLFPKLDA